MCRTLELSRCKDLQLLGSMSIEPPFAAERMYEMTRMAYWDFVYLARTDV